MTPLWLGDQLLALGVAKVVMGWPMVLVVIWLSWQVLQPAYAARRSDDATAQHPQSATEAADPSALT